MGVLEHGANAIYLGVTLDRSLTYRPHTEALRGKLSSRLSLLSKLANTKWGADPKTLRTAALALCYSTAEYCAPVWCRSTHSRKIDPMLIKTCRIITVTLRPTPTNYLYRFPGISPPALQRDTINKTEKRKQENNPRHPLYGHIPAPAQLKSRKSFLTSISLPTDVTPRKFRIIQWNEMEQATIQRPTIPKPREKLPKGTSL
ncbi:uncharacterized protein LOC143019923 [Oratosquilla oratoria]|uniref:uncharacterized protein LOC143019923 n=1 Tax=Oratosquilla oratoria TaxID=337810 RepID=UPI003F768D22